MDTPIIDDFISLDADGSDEYGTVAPSHNASEPLRKMFSFDTLAQSVSQPTDSSLVIRSNSLERLVDVDMPPPARPVVTQADRQKASIAMSESQEGTALTRKATIDSTIFPLYEVEGKEGTKNGVKKRKFDNESGGSGRRAALFCSHLISPLLVSGSGLADGLEQSNPRPPQSYSSPLVRQSAIEYPSAAGNQNQEVVTLLLLPLFVFLLTRCLDSYEENGLNGDCTGLLPLL
jgi:hypothetical protein